MTLHRAKTAALLAYSEGLLSDAGTRRIEAHLAGCEVCQQELAAIELYDRMVDDVHDSDVPEIDFSRMELTLAREAKRVSTEMQQANEAPTGRWLPWAIGGVAAAAVLALFVSGAFESAAPVEQTPVAAGEVATPAPEPTPVSAPLSPRLTLAAGDISRLADERALAVGDTLAPGDGLSVDGEAHVRLEQGLGFVLASLSEGVASVELTRTDVDGVQLALAEGRVDVSVEAPAERIEGWRHDSMFVVLAGRYEVRAEGQARFVTSYVDTELTVGAHAGRLSIHRDGDEVARLEAPGQWSSRPDAVGEPGDARQPRGLGAEIPDAEATLVTLLHPELVRWSLDGTEVAQAGPVQMRVRNGSHRVTGWTLSGEPHELTFEAVGAPTMVDEGQLSVTRPPRMRAGHLEPHIIANVVSRGQRSFQQCWRRSLRENTQAQQGSLQVTIGSLGDVSRVRITGLSGPSASELRECIGNYARRWEFPPPGGPVTFNQPLRFSPSM